MGLVRVAIALLRQLCRLCYRLMKFAFICILCWIAFDFISSAVFPYNIYCSKWSNQRKLRSLPVIRKTRTTCSFGADRRGDHQNVISYSIYGNFSQLSIVYRYLNPFKETVATIPNFYPGEIEASFNVPQGGQSECTTISVKVTSPVGKCWSTPFHLWNT